MPRIAASVSILAIAALSACVHEPSRNEPQIVRQEIPYQPGTGMVEAVTPAPAPVAAAGASGSSRPLNRLTIRMDSGAVQYIDTDSSDFGRGNRIELTPDRMIRKQ
jgi:hypothetical protein